MYVYQLAGEISRKSSPEVSVEVGLFRIGGLNLFKRKGTDSDGKTLDHDTGANGIKASLVDGADLGRSSDWIRTGADDCTDAHDH